MNIAGIKMQYPVIDPLVVIVGPTGVGKSQLSFDVARKLDGEIISADSRLFYRGMDIGTAKLSRDMQTRVPHHMIDIAEPDETIGIRIFQQKTEEIILNIQDRGHLPILVGGTGQYVNAVIQGWSIPPQKPNDELRNVLLNWIDEIGPEEMYEKLRFIDPKAASRIDYRNIRRTIRALEVIFGTGRLFSVQRVKKGSNHRIKMIGLTMPRADLYQKIDQRIEQMIDEGLLNEVQMLLDKGYSTELPAMSAIGYREVSDFLAKKISLQEAVLLIKKRTRQFVRRQANWFKQNDPNIHWFEPDSNLINAVVEFIQSSDGWISEPS